MTITSGRFLTEDFIWEVKRTRVLYVNTAPTLATLPAERRYGFFEPVRLFFCWCDYLGALYLGSAKRGENKRRVVAWLAGPMASTRPEYGVHAEKLYHQYRNPLVHAGGQGVFSYTYEADHALFHLKKQTSGDVPLHIPLLLEDTETAITTFASALVSDTLSRPPRVGTLEAVTKALEEFSQF